MSYAIDRAGIIKACLDEKGVESYQPFSERSEWWYSKELPPTLYSLDKAKELLKSSGYYDRNNDTIIEDNEGHKVSFTFMTNSDNSMRVAMGTLIQSDLRKLGMEVSFSTVPLNQVLNYITETKNFDLILIGLSEGRPADPAMGLNVYLSSGRLHMWYPEQKKPVSEWEGRIDTLPLLFTGKLVLDDLPLLAELKERGILSNPHYLPPPFRDLAALSAWMSFSLYLNQFDLHEIQKNFRFLLV